MILVDTSVWVEFFRGRQPWLDAVSRLFDSGEILTISPIFGELLQGARNAVERKTIVEFWDSIPKAPEDGLFIRAGAESSAGRWHEKGVGLIDSAIVLAARETSSFVWTLDKKLDSLLGREERYTPTI